MPSINIGNAPKNSAVLPFYGTGALYFVALSFMLFFAAPDLLFHYFNPHILGMVHTAALGWGTMIIFGAAYQLLPVICERDLYSERLSFLSYCFLAVGVTILVIAFWNFFTGFWMILGGSCIVIAAALYLINVWQTTLICSKYSIQKMFVLSSAVWLLFTVSLGLILAINLAFPFIKGNHLDILKLHAHAGLAGWFLQLITGVSIKLVPMFLLGKSKKEILLKWSFALQNTGLILFLLDGFFYGTSFRFLCYALLIFSGIILWLIFLYDVFSNRIKKAVDFSMRHTFVSLLCLIMSCLLIPFVYFFSGTKWAILYGTLLFLGWISSIIMGMTFKTLPFIVWNDHYKKLNGKVRVPLPKQLYNEKWLHYQFFIFLGAILLLALGICIVSIVLIRIALFFWIILALVYVTNVAKVLNHKTKILDGNSIK
ncbi:hypothetical protein [Arachidicoccus sp.]|uniref:hypothetical protein n=1 Tax=Arachidicoccus sp. TaxID=1872624 RepID=UPI003D1CA3E0